MFRSRPEALAISVSHSGLALLVRASFHSDVVSLLIPASSSYVTSDRVSFCGFRAIFDDSPECCSERSSALLSHANTDATIACFPRWTRSLAVQGTRKTIQDRMYTATSPQTQPLASIATQSKTVNEEAVEGMAVADQRLRVSAS
jgi:hypothetical protein